MNLRQRMQQLTAQIDALSLRERAILMLGAFMVLFLLWDRMLMADITRRGAAVNAEITTTRTDIGRLNTAIANVAHARGDDPDAVLRAQIDAARRDIARIDNALAERAGQVIPPGEMADVLQEILQRQQRLKLVSMTSLPPEALLTADEEREAGLNGSIYRHGLEFEIEGRYLDVLGYLRELESLQWQFSWDALELESIEYPVNRVRIRVHSLNLEEGWLGV